MVDAPLTNDELGPQLAEVLAILGPLYRKCQRVVEEGQDIEGASIGVRAVLDMLRIHGDMTVPQMARTQALSRQFVQRMTNEARDNAWVELRSNPRHKRSSVVSLTAAGSGVIEAIARREQSRLGSIGGDLSMADIYSCKRVLSSLLEELRDIDV